MTMIRLLSYILIVASLTSCAAGKISESAVRTVPRDGSGAPIPPGSPGEVVEVDCSSVTTPTRYDEVGEGTSLKPYVICNAEQFVSIGKDSASWNSSFVLGADIDLAAYDGSLPALTIETIGTYNRVTSAAIPFTGTFHGNNHEIRNARVRAVTNYSVGLFGHTRGAQISFLKVLNVDVGGDGYVGGVIGYAINTSAHDLTVSGVVNATDARVGGVVGEFSAISGKSELVDVSVTATVTGRDATAGLVGLVLSNGEYRIDGSSLLIAYSSFAGAIGQSGAGNSFGGAIGYLNVINSGDAKIINNSAAATINLTNQGALSGGFVGNILANAKLTIERARASGSITTPASFTAVPGRIGGVGGLMVCTGTCVVENASYTGTITILNSTVTPTLVGGAFGGVQNASGSSRLQNLSFTGGFNIQRSTTTFLGGIIGRSVTSGSGTIGISKVFAASTLTGTVGATSKGGALGGTSGTGNTFADCYWDSTLWASGGLTVPAGIAGRTTTQLQAQATFLNWNFTDVWQINEGLDYPALR